MKPMYEIATQRDIVEHRARLLTQLRQDEKRLRKDTERVQKTFDRISSVGTALNNIIGILTPRLNFFLTGFSLAKRLIRKRK